MCSCTAVDVRNGLTLISIVRAVANEPTSPLHPAPHLPVQIYSSFLKSFSVCAPSPLPPHPPALPLCDCLWVKEWCVCLPQRVFPHAVGKKRPHGLNTTQPFSFQASHWNCPRLWCSIVSTIVSLRLQTFHCTEKMVRTKTWRKRKRGPSIFFHHSFCSNGHVKYSTVKNICSLTDSLYFLLNCHFCLFQINKQMLMSDKEKNCNNYKKHLLNYNCVY